MLDAIPAQDAATELMGFIGLVKNAQDQVRESGFVVTRSGAASHLASNPVNERAISLDELGIIVHRETLHRIDPAFGWHLWGTDLCLQAEQRFPARPARTLGVPIFHNSNFDGTLPAGFDASGKILLEKYPELAIIPSLCKCLVRA
ncbi:MAG: hypothetical protein ACRYGK_05890 [Janthinobacterium lividum]